MTAALTSKGFQSINQCNMSNVCPSTNPKFSSHEDVGRNAVRLFLALRPEAQADAAEALLWLLSWDGDDLTTKAGEGGTARRARVAGASEGRPARSRAARRGEASILVL